MSSPLVSIIISSYNSAEFLPETLASALNQVGGQTEVIVVDDGSTDSTPDIVRSFGSQIQSIRQENGGVSSARNRGADAAQGEWLLFLDSDDRLLPYATQNLLKTAAAHPPAGVVYGMVIERAEPPKEPRLNGFDYCAGAPPLPAQRGYARSVIITPGSAIVQKSLHARIGGFVPTFEPMEDRDYWIKCGLLEPFRFVDAVVLDKTWRPTSAGRQNARRIWNGLRSRLQLAQWGEQHQVAIDSLPTDRVGAIESALKEATQFRSTAILPALIAEARAAGVSPRWLWPARLTLLTQPSVESPAWMLPLKEII